MFLNKLIPHVDLEDVVFVGGVVSRYHVSTNGLKYPDRPFDDLDAMVSRKETIRPSVINDFLIYHYHLGEDKLNKNIYIVLANGKTKARIDFFDANDRPSEKIVLVPFGKYKLQIRSIEDQLVELVKDMYRIINVTGFKNKPGYYIDADLLMKIADLDLVQKYWEKKEKKNFIKSVVWRDKVAKPLPDSFIQAYKESTDYAKKHPELVSVDHYRKKELYKCPYCIDTLDFPITPMEKVYKALGYNT